LFFFGSYLSFFFTTFFGLPGFRGSFTVLHRVFEGCFIPYRLGCTGFYWVLLGFYRVSIRVSVIYESMASVNDEVFFVFYRVLKGFANGLCCTGFYWVLLGFTGFYRVSMCASYTDELIVSVNNQVFFRVFSGFERFFAYVVLRFYWVLPIIDM